MRKSYFYSDTMEQSHFMRIMSSGLRWLWLVAVVILLDRVSKYWVANNLALFEPMPIFSFFNLTLAYNTGASFGFLHTASGWQQWLFGGLAVVISAVVLVWMSRISARSKWLCIALGLILAGALGNAWDRVLYGFVVDFLDFHWGDWHFAIFNIADSAICVGVFMLMVDWMRNK